MATSALLGVKDGGGLPQNLSTYADTTNSNALMEKVTLADATSGVPAGVDSGGNVAVKATGAAAQGATAAGNPLLAGAVFKTTPATITDGQVATLQTDNTQNLLTKTVGLAAPGTAVASAGNPIMMAGNDGVHSQALLTDTSGRPIVVGAAAASAAAAGNPVQIGGVFAAPPALLTAGNVGALQVDGNQQLRATLDSCKPAYSLSIPNIAPVAQGNDYIQIVGSASKTVRVKRVKVSAVPGIGTAASQQIGLYRRSTSGAASTTWTAVTTLAKHDTGNAAATAVINQMTANSAPQVIGTAAGTLRQESLFFPAATGANLPVVWEFSTRSDQAIVLRGVSDFLCVGMGTGATGATAGTLGQNINVEIEWEEDNS